MKSVATRGKDGGTARGESHVCLSSFRELERLPGPVHPAVYHVRFSCSCGDDHDAPANDIKRAEDGALSIFDGIVRDHSRNRKTLFLDYEAYEEMALKQMEELAEKAVA